MIFSMQCQLENPRDLGYLLHKHPDKVQTFFLSFGVVTVFFPQIEENLVQFALLLEVDPIQLVRENKTNSIDQYVNDRPYVSSSLWSVVLSQVLGTAMNGTSKERPELAQQKLNWTIEIPVLSCKGNERRVRSLFESLDYEVICNPLLLEDSFLEKTSSSYLQCQFKTQKTLSEMLSQFYILLPVLDDSKHYWVSDSEVDKLVDKGKDWLPQHPEKEWIVRRFLKNSKDLVALAKERLGFEPEKTEDLPFPKVPNKKLHTLRLESVVEAIQSLPIQTLLDVGCGEGKLIQKCLPLSQLTSITGIDVSSQILEVARRKCNANESFSSVGKASRLQFFQSSVHYLDERLIGNDCAVAVEVIEHLEAYQLDAFVKNVFGYLVPNYVIVTTPNVEYNVLYENLREGEFRHTDHRFEWTRKEFRTWCHAILRQFPFEVEFYSLGEEHPQWGAPSQMALFTKKTR